MRTLSLYQTLLIPSLHSKIPNSAAILKPIAMQLRGARWPGVNKTMSDNKLVKTIMDSATLTGLAAGIGWACKKVLKEDVTANPSAQRHELRQVHRRHGCQPRDQTIPRGQKNSS